MSDTIEGLLGPKPPQTIEGILGPREVAEPSVWDGAFADEYFSQSSAGRILDLFGQGAQKGYGYSPTPEFDKWAKDNNIPIKDYQSTQEDNLKGIHNELMRSTALTTDAALRKTGEFAGALAATGVQLANIFAIDPLIAAGETIRKAIAGEHVTEEETLGAASFGVGGSVVRNSWRHLQALEAANDLGAVKEVGNGMSPREAARTSLAPTGQPGPAERVILPAEEGPPIEASAVEPPASPPQDIHTLARQIAPDTFAEYDELQGQHAFYTRWIDELGEERNKELQSRIDNILDKVGGVEDRLTNVAKRRLERAREEYDNFSRRDTPAMAALRQDREAFDARMRELAPDVSRAYRDARDAMPPPPEPATAPPTTDMVPPTAPEPTPTVVPAESPEIYNLLQRRPTIAADVSRQLIAAGRPEAEARAAAALIQAHYEARAKRFNGALGSARDLYEREDPFIQTGEGNARGRLDLVRNQVTLFKDADASTFIHESAHNWLEEMQRDAVHEAAPQDLKDDLKTIRDWLGAEGSITRAQHERFARGFERYLMEGIAPSNRLAQVFAKFKDWLTQIYQKLGALRAPINDQIRGVYDRLLSMHNEPVIAPEREVAANFADIHERDAATARPENALKTADEIEAERAQIAQIMRAEIMNGRRRARAERSGGPTETTPVGDQVPPRTGPDDTGAVREETAAEPSAVSPSGAKFKAKSDVPGPGESFGPADGRLVDKTGELRLDNVEAPDDVDAALREQAERTGGRTAATDGQLLDLADAIGVNPSFLNGDAVRTAWSSQEIRFGMDMLRRAETNVRDKMIQAAEGGDALELAQSIAQLEMIQGKLSAVASEWGYAGHALRALKEYTGGDLASILRETTGRSYDQLMQMARLVASHPDVKPGQIGRFVNDTRGGRIRQAMFNYWMQSVLSGPFTHVVYGIGNMINAVGEPVGTAVAAGIHQIRGGGPDGVYWREVGASLHGLISGFENSLPFVKEAFSTGQNIPLPGEKGFGNSMGTFISPGIGLPAAATPTHYIAALHQFGKGIRYEQAKNRLAVRQALDEELEGEAANARIAKLQQWPTDAMSEEAAQTALTEMYMKPSQYNTLASAIQRVAHKSVIGDFLFPFLKINFQIQRQTWLKMTPLGLADKEIRNQLLMRDGGASFDNAAAKQLLGISALGMGAVWAANGMITGYGPPDPEQHRAWTEEGNVPYSIQVGNLRIPYKGFGPISGLLSFAADGYEAQRSDYMRPNEPHPWAKLAQHYTEAVARAALDEGFFRELHDLSRVVNEPGQFAMQWLYNYLPSWLPYSTALSQTNRNLFDPYTKDVENIFDAFRAKVPGASQFVPNRYDIFGQPRLARGMTFDRYANDPTMQYLRRMNIGIGALDKKINGVELTPEQRGDYAKNAGVLSKQLLDDFVADQRATSAPHGIQLREIHSLLESARKAARAVIKQQSIGTDNDLVEKGAALKLKALE
jgi:hypothetical protein